MVWALLCLNTTAIAQDAQHQRKYWTARDRLQKWFVKIDPNQGGSIPIDKRTETLHHCTGATMAMGDATSYLGWYIGVLATEYRILMNDNQPAQARETLNELYYALYAVNRLDDDAEGYFSGQVITTKERNGFYMRDDFRKNFWENWQNAGYKFDNNSEYKSVSASYINCGDPIGHINDENKLTKDQSLALMMGFAMVVKYVDNVWVQPAATDVPRKLVDEAIASTRTIMDAWTGWNEWAREFMDIPCQHWRYYKTSWISIDPTIDLDVNPDADRRIKFSNQIVTQYDWMLAYPFGTLANDITGSNDYAVDYYAGWETGGGCGATSAKDKLEFMDGLRNTWSAIYFAMQNDGSFANITLPFTVTFKPPSITPVPSQITIPASPEVNAQIMLNLAALTGTWSRHRVHEVCRNTNLRVFELMFDLFNNHPEDVPDGVTYSLAEEINNLLNQFPDFGSHYYLSTSNGGFWDRAHKWMHPGPNGTDDNNPAYGETGRFNSLDFMMLYNLFRLKYYKNYYNTPTIILNSFLPADKEKYLCSEVEELPQLKSVTDLNQTAQIEYRFLNYDAFDLKLYEFLQHDININQDAGGTGVLKCNTNLKVCNIIGNPSTSLAVNANSKIEVGDNTTAKKGVIRIMPGNELVLNANGVLEIADNSRVIIEEGAFLKVYPNAQINLNGANAVLEIKGTLELMPDAIFQTAGTGYVLFNIPNGDRQPNVVVNGNNCQMIFENAGAQTKKMEIASNTYLYLPSLLNLFKMENVKAEFGLNAGIKLNWKFHIVNNDIGRIPTVVDNSGPAPSTMVHNGIAIYGITQTTFITDNNFSDAKTALTILNPVGYHDIKVHYNSFSRCREAIVQRNGRSHVFANSFVDCEYAVQGKEAARTLRFESNYIGSSTSSMTGTGFTIHSPNYADVAITGNVFDKTYFGLYAGKALSTLKCNYFNENKHAITYYDYGELNISTANASVGISLANGTALTGGVNYLNIPLNSYGIKVESYYGNPFFLNTRIDNGLNTFYNLGHTNTAGSRSSLDIYRPLNNLTVGSSYTINNNYWGPVTCISMPNSNDPQFIDNNILGSVHFNITENYQPSYIKGTISASTTTCPIANWSDALQNPTTFDPHTKKPPTGSGPSLNTFRGASVISAFDNVFGGTATTQTVPGGTYAGQNVKTGFRNVFTGFTETVPVTGGTEVQVTPQGLLNLANILNATATISSPEVKQMHTFGYQVYLSSIGDAIGNARFEGDEPAINAQLTAANTLFNTIIATYESLPDTPKYKMRFNAEFDRMIVHWMFKKYNEALTINSNINQFVQSGDANRVSYWNCIIENERKLMSDEISWMEYEEYTNNCALMYPLSYPNGGGASSGGEEGGGGQPTNTLSYVIAPNPATTEITLSVTQNFEANISVMVFDKFGIEMMEPQNEGLKNGTYNVIVPVSGLTTDVYTVVLYADGIPYSQQFVKVNE